MNRTEAGRSVAWSMVRVSSSSSHVARSAVRSDVHPGGMPESSQARPEALEGASERSEDPWLQKQRRCILEGCQQRERWRTLVRWHPLRGCSIFFPCSRGSPLRCDPRMGSPRLFTGWAEA